MIHYLPLEHIDQRYTRRMDEDILKALQLTGLPFHRYYPEVNQRHLPDGMFLDAPTTIEFKSQQLAQLARSYQDGRVNDGDIVFCSDLWMPGIEAVAYLNFFASKDVRLRGIMHAGSWTDTDFVRRMERWACKFEEAVLDIADHVFVASEFSRKELLIHRAVDPSKASVVPFVLDDAVLAHRKQDRTRTVVFNGRLCDEKQPHLFLELQSILNRQGVQAEFIMTQAERFSKDDYHALLGRSAVVVSFALQENFGFGINEAVLAGCVPVVPDRLVYREFYDERYRYTTIDDCANKVRLALDGQLAVPAPVQSTINDLKRYFQ